MEIRYLRLSVRLLTCLREESKALIKIQLARQRAVWIELYTTSKKKRVVAFSLIECDSTPTRSIDVVIYYVLIRALQQRYTRILRVSFFFHFNYWNNICNILSTLLISQSTKTFFLTLWSRFFLSRTKYSLPVMLMFNLSVLIRNNNNNKESSVVAVEWIHRSNIYSLKI